MTSFKKLLPAAFAALVCSGALATQAAAVDSTVTVYELQPYTWSPQFNVDGCLVKVAYGPVGSSELFRARYYNLNACQQVNFRETGAFTVGSAFASATQFASGATSQTGTNQASFSSGSGADTCGAYFEGTITVANQTDVGAFIALTDDAVPGSANSVRALIGRNLSTTSPRTPINRQC